MNMNDIERALKQLRLSGISTTLSTRVLEAQGAQQSFLETFGLILQDELDRRKSRLNERRFKHSGLEERQTLQDFDWGFNPKLPRRECFELHTLKFISQGGNAILLGSPGTGKSHIAKAIGYHATLSGYNVRYLEADAELARHALGSPYEQQKLLHKALHCDLLILDDLFLARSISETAAELLQSIVHQRYKRHAAIVLTSNRLIDDWGKYLGDNTAATTIVDRLMHSAALLKFEGKSYRLKELASRITQPTEHHA
jgi:DNA replication protein DnaC